MRKVMFAVTVSSVALAVAPALALAQGHHHRRHHDAQRRHLRHEHFGSRNDQMPAPSDAPGAGTVASVSNGVLAIRLNDRSIVSGRLTHATEIQCEAAGSQMQHGEHDDQGDHGDHGDQSVRGDRSDNGNDENGNNDQEGQDERGEHVCSVADLMPGARVADAELTVSRGDAVWNEVDLAG